MDGSAPVDGDGRGGALGPVLWPLGRWAAAAGRGRVGPPCGTGWIRGGAAAVTAEPALLPLLLRLIALSAEAVRGSRVEWSGCTVRLSGRH